MTMSRDELNNIDFPQAEHRCPDPVSAPVVLVVEDDTWTREAVGGRLQAAGFEVLLVPSAADALIVAQRSTFDVLVLDLNLPDGSNTLHNISDGFSMLDWLRRQLVDFRFKIVVHTSERSPHILAKATEYDVFAVCYKQPELDGLVQCVTRAVNSIKVATSHELFL